MTDSLTLSAQSQALASKQLFIARDGGFTSVGVVVALLLSLTLLFTATQVRWVQGQSADIQFVADAGALAGENLVGEYLVAARLADAVVLSLSLLGITTCGIAIVVSCIPYAQGVGKALMDFGRQVFDARNKVADTAAKALDRLQAVLPFLIAVNAAATIEANGGGTGGSARYHGLAIPLPLQGEDMAFTNDDETQASTDDLEENNRNTAQLTDAAQKALDEMNAAKLEGWLADCGNNPAYCMYERAGKLADLSGAQNPSFSSQEVWLFDYAFVRAKTYYAKRLSLEKPADATIDEQVKSYCREQFYRYAVDEFSKGWCKTSADGVLDARFPSLPKNTEEMRSTTLYTNKVFPTSADGHIHGTPLCPALQGAGAGPLGSAADLDAGIYSRCASCDFTASSLGKVAQASSTTGNGFEYFYRKVADAAKRYQQATNDYNKESGAAKESAGQAFDLFEKALAALATPRLKPHPPGRNGVIAFVVDLEAHTMPAGITTTLVGGSAEIGPRIALSAAALAEDAADDGGNILASFLDKARAEAESSQAGFALGALGVFDGILEIWGSALLVYNRGGEALSQGLVDFLDSIPVVKATPLSRWARDVLNDTVRALGLEGATLDTPRPVIVNSLHVLRTSSAPPAVALRQAKEGYSALPGASSGSLDGYLFNGLTGLLANHAASALEQEFTLFEISFGDAPGLPRIPIKVKLPGAVVEQGQGLIRNIEGNLGSVYSGGGGRSAWQ